MPKYSAYEIDTNVIEKFYRGKKHYTIHDYHTDIVIIRDLEGDLYIEKFYSNHPFSPYYDSDLPRTPKGAASRLLCTVLKYILEKDIRTKKDSMIGLLAEGGNAGGSTEKLLKLIYFPMGFEINEGYDEADLDGGVPLISTVQEVMKFCKRYSRRKPLGIRKTLLKRKKSRRDTQKKKK